MSQAGINSIKKIPPPPGSVTDLQGQDGVTVPPDGAGIIHVVGTTVVAGSTPFTTTGNAGTSTETWSIQRTQAIAATDSTKIGLAAFNSANFSVDANGFVSLASTPQSILSVALQTGTTPIVPNGAGQIAFNGSVVAAGTNPVRTDGTGASTMALEIQITQALAASDATKIGLANFNSANFTCDVNGFVSLVNPLFHWIDIGVSSILATNTGYFVTAASTQTLPAVPAQGQVVKIIADTTGAVVVTANAGQSIRVANAISSVGGTMTSTLQGDSLELVYRAATTTWFSEATNGVWVPA